MRILGIILLMMLSACVCKKIKKYKPIERCAYSAQFDKCRCHKYDLNTGKRISGAIDYDAEYCDDVVGFKFKDWKTEVTPKIQYNYSLYCDHCKKR